MNKGNSGFGSDEPQMIKYKKDYTFKNYVFITK